MYVIEWVDVNWTDRSAFIQAHLASWLHGPSDRCKNDCPANGLAIKVLNLQLWGEVKTDLHRSEATNGEKKREGREGGIKREGFEILWAVIVWLVARSRRHVETGTLYRVIISNARRREIPHYSTLQLSRRIVMFALSPLASMFLSLVTLYQGLLRFSHGWRDRWEVIARAWRVESSSWITLFGSNFRGRRNTSGPKLVWIWIIG